MIQKSSVVSILSNKEPKYEPCIRTNVIKIAREDTPHTRLDSDYYSVGGGMRATNTY